MTPRGWQGTWGDDAMVRGCHPFPRSQAIKKGQGDTVKPRIGENPLTQKKKSLKAPALLHLHNHRPCSHLSSNEPSPVQPTRLSSFLPEGTVSYRFSILFLGPSQKFVYDHPFSP